jgi:hypothetical protein
VRSRSRFVLGLTLSLAFLSSAAEGQVFKCKDADGKVTYTDVPCLRSETSSVVDTRASANVADHSAIRKEAGRLPSSAATTASPAPAQASSGGETPAVQTPSPRSPPRSGGYYR